MAEGSSRRSGRQAPDEHRDDEIIRIAAHEFRVHGFHATSMQQIADVAGLQKGSLYHHFAGKEEILIRIIERAGRLMLDPLRVIVGSDHPPDVKLRAAIRNHVLGICRQQDETGVLLMEARTLTGPAALAAATDRREYEGHFVEILRQGNQAGLFWPRDPKITAYTLFGMGNWIVQWYRPDGALQAETLADFVADLTLAAVTVTPSRPGRP
ncbi:MAG TPA: TetR/AcrR family transcriptional regulator [Dehalococcoidia bacterium]|nr:TetR/AcrR family transcriptional regulator [Dehalococcoidia bacterium]